MKGTRRRFIMRLTAYAALATAAVLALAYALGMCERSSAPVVVTLLFEAISLVCFWISGGDR